MSRGCIAASRTTDEPSRHPVDPFCNGGRRDEWWRKRVWGEYDMCVIRLPVVAVSRSPPVSLDKLTILFMPALPFTLVTLQLDVFQGSPTAGSDGPETTYFTPFSSCQIYSRSLACSVHSPAVCGSRVCHGGVAISLFEWCALWLAVVTGVVACRERS